MGDVVGSEDGQQRPLSRLAKTRGEWGRRVLSPWARGFLERGVESMASVRRRSRFAVGTRMLLARVRGILARSRVWKPDVGSLEPAFTRRFSHLLVNRYREAVRPIARKQTASFAQAWGEDLDLTLPGRVSEPFGQTGELQAGMRIAPRETAQTPGMLTVGQRIEPLSGSAPSSVQSLFEARAASVGTTSPPSRSRRSRPRQQDRRQLSPDARLFSRVEEVKPGGAGVPPAAVPSSDPAQQVLSGEDEQPGMVESVETIPESAPPDSSDRVSQVSPSVTHRVPTRQARAQTEGARSETLTRSPRTVIQRSPRTGAVSSELSAVTKQSAPSQRTVSEQPQVDAQDEESGDRRETTTLPAALQRAARPGTESVDGPSTAQAPAVEASRTGGAQSSRRSRGPAPREADSSGSSSGDVESTEGPESQDRPLEELAGERTIPVAGPVESRESEEKGAGSQSIVPPPTQARGQTRRTTETRSRRVPSAPASRARPVIQRQPDTVPPPAPAPRRPEESRSVPDSVISRSDESSDVAALPTPPESATRQESTVPTGTQRDRRPETTSFGQEPVPGITAPSRSDPARAETRQLAYRDVEPRTQRGQNQQSELPVRPSRPSGAGRVPVGVPLDGPRAVQIGPVSAGDASLPSVTTGTVLAEGLEGPLPGMARRIQRRYRHPTASVRGLSVQRAPLLSLLGSQARGQDKTFGMMDRSAFIPSTGRSGRVFLSRLTEIRRRAVDNLSRGPRDGSMSGPTLPLGERAGVPMSVPAKVGSLRGDDRVSAHPSEVVRRTGKSGRVASSRAPAMRPPVDQDQNIPALIAALEEETARSRDLPLLPRIAPESQPSAERVETSPVGERQVTPISQVSSISSSLVQRVTDEMDIDSEMSTDDLSQLARLVYPFVKRLLAIERERWPRR